jgi:nucleotide-binding universal stress UspA family protein
VKPIKKILVPVDFTEHSAEALRIAADLARRYEASLDLLHVVQTMTYALPEGYVVPTADVLDKIMTLSQVQLTAAKKAAIEAGAPSVETTLLQGGVASGILGFAEEHHVDLIVMGTHGHTGMKHMLLGSVAEHIVRVAASPVLTVRSAP